jgi:PAS domain S-box-containing protein
MNNKVLISKDEFVNLKKRVKQLELEKELAENQQTLHALRESEERFRLIAENTADTITVYDLDLNIIYVSPSILSLRGYTIEETLSQKLDQILTPVSFSKARKLFTEQILLESAGQVDPNRSESLELEEYCKDGSVISVELSLTFLRNSDLTPKGVLTVSRNITERKLAEKERQANFHFFESMDKINRAMQGTNNLEQMMSDVLDTMLSIFDCQRAFLVYPCDPEAPSWRAVMERTQPGYPGANARGMEYPNDTGTIRNFRIMMETNGPVTFGPGFDEPLTKDLIKNHQIQSMIAMPIFPKGDKPYMFGLHECTKPRVWTQDEKRLLQEIGRRFSDGLTSLVAYRNLMESENKYRRIVDTTIEGIWIVDPDDTITFANAQMAGMLGYTIEEMMGCPVTKFMFKENVFEHLEMLEKHRQGEARNFERRFCHRDGHTVWTHVSASPIMDAGSHFIGAFAMCTDITERKHADDTIHALNETLESRLLALTQPIDNMSGIQLSDLFNIDELQKIQDAFALATGVASIITDTQGHPITKPSNFCKLCEQIIRKTEKGLINCYCSDAALGQMHKGGPILQKCLSGSLWDGGSSICLGDQHIGNWLIGQVLEEPFDKGAILAYAKEIGANEEEFCKALDKVTRMPLKQFERIGDTLYLIANQLSKLALQNVQQARFITERKQAEEELNRERTLLRTVIDNIPDPVYVKDLHGKKIMANLAEARMSGKERVEDILEKADEDLYSAEIATHTKTEEDEIFRTGNPVKNYESKFTVPNGAEHWIIGNKILLKDNRGNPTGLLGISHDITERKLAEISLRESEAKLIKALEIAEHANQSKSEFLANMSHEIRTPMNAILGFSEALFHKTDDPKHKQMLQSILKSGNILLSLINDILDMSKIEAGKLELNIQTVDIKNIFAEIIQIFSQKIQKKGLEFLTSVPGPLPRIMLDETRIRQILLNLMSNAIKFTDSGFVSLHLDFYKNTDQYGKLSIVVEDSGIGIPISQQELIFDAFRQQAGQSNRKYEGTGLGLSITKKLVQKMNGTIELNSSPGKGSKFSVTIDHVEYLNIAPAPKVTEPEFTITFKPSLILVVDDVKSNIKAIESLLDNPDISILEAENGEIALEILNYHTPDAILMDLRMLGMDGYEVSRNIRNNPKFQKTPIIAVTASVFDSKKIKETLLFDSIIFKPVNKTTLVNELKKYLLYSIDNQTQNSKSETTPNDDLTALEKAQLPELLKLLKEKHYEEWKTVNNKLLIFKIEKFTANLTETLAVYNNHLLRNYVNNVKLMLEVLDLDNINATVREYPKLIDKLSKY